LALASSGRSASALASFGRTSAGVAGVAEYMRPQPSTLQDFRGAEANRSLIISWKTAKAASTALLEEEVRRVTPSHSLDVAEQDRQCEIMKNITVSLDDDTYRRARMIAAQRDTSVSALVKQFLLELASGESETERLKRQERELRERITDFDGSDRLSRDDVHRHGA
jgi:hypothetical protein